ncbi:MAG TPA: DNA-formamidopyrimidine glycosylase family protein [Mycobacteriales bacterium]|nr:DNA-formamidopyrimidine glycosylase family protein [Mycobacteriales bacterium]
MPEGHTLHRLARDHTPLLVGRQISATSPQGRFAEGAEVLSGRTVERVRPYGKHLFYETSGDVLLHVHLGLYGAFTRGTGPSPAPRGALRLRLVAGDTWIDLRGPTACELFTPEDRDRVLARLGPDPLHRGSDPRPAWERLSRSRRAVGELLMDQSVLAGVGNVYRAEALYRVALSPFRPGREVPEDVWRAMWEDLQVLMRAGVRAGHIVTTEREDRERRTGRLRREDRFYVYRRHGQACRRCGSEVRTAVMAARNLFWCPVCQPEAGPPGVPPVRG